MRLATSSSAARSRKAVTRPAGGRRRPSPGSGRAKAEVRRRTAKRTGSSAKGKGSTASGKRRARATVAGTELSYYVLIPTAALLLLGLVMVFSAGSAIGIDQSAGGYRIFVQQLVWAGLGLVMMFVFSRFDYHKLGKVSWVGVLVSISLLVLVLVFGREAGGARRWLEIGSLNLQPTEIAKFTLVVFSAYALAMKGDKVKRFIHLLVPVLLVMVLEAALILKQPDLGSTLVMCFSVFLVLIIARTRLNHLALIGVAGGAAATFFMLIAPYRRARLFSFVNPWSCSRGAGYQVIQSYIALGSGNIKGLGLGMSRQKFLYLPNAHNDFIFAIIGEELGIVGTLLVVSLVGLLVYGGFRIAAGAPDELGKLLAAGITGLIVIQALVNMGGVTGMLPITGVPLPLVSFGGSSLCICLACIGILLNVASQGKR
ncbi:MAG: putative lipid II flippase FtsW [Actinobacteria bacterium]|nr:putative lipid II flippase FtsW [Actinomycetota bacterium]MBU4392226.1 putative lipid II flippase FtsW [Actinomycetota bacterium]MCG2818483.1 putative lipid II flippase FtsW [Actinomycetes bacterium]